MRRRRRGDEAQLQLLESVMVALFIFVAIAVVAIFRLPTSPQTFESAALEKIGLDVLGVRKTAPSPSADCNDTPCPFTSDLDRLLSLSLGYVGVHADAGEAPDSSELRGFLNQTLKSVRYRFTWGNGHNQTMLSPASAFPPSRNVVVARTLIEPNWTVFARTTFNATVLRIGELTGFANAASSITDPLGRTSDEWGATWASRYGSGLASRVPAAAVLGNHRVCFALAPGGCWNVTIVPATGGAVVGPGSQILDADRDADGALADFNPLGSSLAELGYSNDQAPAGPSARDPAYLHLPTTLIPPIPPQAVAAGDVRLSMVDGDCRNNIPCPPGSYVRAGDIDVGRPLTAFTATTTQLRASNATVSEWTRLYLLSNDAATTPGAFDLRLSRAGVHPMGSRVLATDEDVGGDALSPLALTAVRVRYADRDGDGAHEEGEPVYFDLNGLGQGPDLDVGDYRASSGTTPPQRYTYDIKLEVWHGL